MEIIYILSGRAGIVLMGKNALLKAEDFIVLNSMDYHDIYKEAGCHSLSALIPLSLLRESGTGLVFCCSALQPEQSEYMDLIRGKLAVVYKNYLEFGQKRKSYILSEVFGILAILKEQFALEQAESLQEHHAAISRMRDILIDLQNHYMENLTLEKLAANHYLSQAYLSRQFEHQLGLHFTDYLKNLRIQKAERLLLMTEKSVTEVAQDVGYANPNTFIIHFRDIYGVTPGVYRRQNENSASEKNKIHQYNAENVYYVNLLKHASREEMNEPLHKKLGETKIIHAEISHSQQADLKLSCKTVDFGYASNYYKSVNRQNLIRVMEEIRCSYVFVNGVFDDAMSVYHEEVDGKPWYQFTYLDPVLEEICGHDAVPWIELGRIPGDLIADKKNIFQGGYVQLPNDLNKWKKLLEVTFSHYKDLYGKKTSKWKFSVFPALYAAYGIFTMDSWLEFYKCTFQAIRENIPGASISGGTFDTVMLRQDGEDAVLQFLDYCTLHDCMPDELGLQSFAVDYAGISRKDLEENIRGKDENYLMEPAPPSKNRHKLKSDILFVKDILAKRNMEKLCYPAN
jgi:xylan 1,4-beta-xylosidase